MDDSSNSPFHFAFPIILILCGIALLPELSAEEPFLVQDARVLDDSTGEKHGPPRKYRETDLKDVGIVTFKNDVGTRVGVFNRSSKGPQSWIIVMNGDVFADITEVKREDNAIFLKQDNSIEEYKLDLKAGKIFNRNSTNQRVWAQILEMTQVMLMSLE